MCHMCPCRMRMKFRNRVIAAVLAIFLILGNFQYSSAATTTNTQKEEVVYVNLNADGKVKEIYVVNIFELTKAGTIIDYGAYKALRNMTGTSPIAYVNNMVRIDADAGKHYYEGELQSLIIPWDIDIHYFVDGKEYSPEAVAGKTGALKMTIDITRNNQYDGTFFENMALQVSATLDTAKCRNIVANGATVANVGRSKQLTYTVLPGMGAHLEVTSDVVDFTMDGIAINGVRLNLNLDVDLSPLMGRVDELFDAIGKMDEGASALHQGMSSLYSAAESDLTNGVNAIVGGVDELKGGADALRTGGQSLQDGAKDLHGGTVALNEGIQTLNDGIQQMQKALDLLDQQSGQLNGGSSAYMSAMVMLQESLKNMQSTSGDVSALTEASDKVLDGLTRLVQGAEALGANVSFEALKRIMAQNGLDVDYLQSSNSYAMEQLQDAIDNNRSLIGLLELLGYDLAPLFDQLEQVILLLDANNAFIDGTGTYLNAVNSNISELAYNAALLQTSYALFDVEIDKLAATLKSLPESMGTLTSAVNTLVDEYRNLDNGIGSYTGAVAEIAVAYAKIADGAMKLASSGETLKNGSETLYQGTSNLLSGIVDVYEGSITLQNGTSEMKSGVVELISGIAELYDGTSAIKNGASEMHNQTTGMDGVIEEQIGNMLSGISGNNTEVHSFVSDENTNVESVQFVIRTAAIKQPTLALEVEPAPVKLTFWQKILKLFGLLNR